MSGNRCVKSVRIRSYSGPRFPEFGLNTERYSVSLYSIRMRENADQNISEYAHFYFTTESLTSFRMKKLEKAQEKYGLNHVLVVVVLSLTILTGKNLCFTEFSSKIH